MISFKFVLDEEDDFDGLSMGFLDVYGNCGTIAAENHDSTKLMMLNLSAVNMLDGLRLFVAMKKTSFEFVGADSSFVLKFVRDGRNTVSVIHEGEAVAVGPETELVADICEFTHYLIEVVLGKLSTSDMAYSDLNSAVLEFQSLCDTPHR